MLDDLDHDRRSARPARGTCTVTSTVPSGPAAASAGSGRDPGDEQVDAIAVAETARR